MKAKKTKILIVDDDKFLSSMYADKFNEEGFDVHVGLGSVDALEQLRGGLNGIEIVLLDIIMPVLDGFEFLKIIKQENLLQGAKIIVLSNVGQADDSEKAFALGATDYVVKAYFTPPEIVKKVNALLSLPKK